MPYYSPFIFNEPIFKLLLSYKIQITLLKIKHTGYNNPIERYNPANKALISRSVA